MAAKKATVKKDPLPETITVTLTGLQAQSLVTMLDIAVRASGIAYQGFPVAAVAAEIISVLDQAKQQG